MGWASGGGQEGETPGGTQTLHVVPRPQAAVRVGGLLFYFISLESSAHLPSLSPFLWGPRELLSFDKGERKSAPSQAAFARVPPKQGRGAGAVGLGRGAVDGAWLTFGSAGLKEGALSI